MATPVFLSSVQCHGGDGGADLCRDGLLARGVCVVVSLVNVAVPVVATVLGVVVARYLLCQ